MTELSREEVRRLAIEAGFNPAEKYMKHYRGTISDLERFAAAIYEAGAKSERAARAEREGRLHALWSKDTALLATERAVADRLLEALKRVIGSHFAPNDCYATGPLTGNYHRDFVECPSCTGEALIAEVEALRKEKPE